jgi:phosphoenolpyruvate-protein phosphotransferase
VSDAAAPQRLVFTAPVTGLIVPLAEVPDETFATGLAGGGASIEPLGALVVAPCDARVTHVHRSHHALTMVADDLEILIHVGIDTVGLHGAGFDALVQAGDIVQRGDPLLRFDADLVARRARSLLTQVLVSNMERVASIEVASGRVEAGRDILFTVTRAAGSAADLEASSAVVKSPSITITARAGLHARPAAMLAAASRRFLSDVRLLKDGGEANLRSVVAILALEVAEGDHVRLVARGDDADLAIAELGALAAGPLAAAPLAEAATAGADDSSMARPMPAPDRVPPDPAPGVLVGVAASPGVAIGDVVQLRQADDQQLEEHAPDPNHERRALDAAIAAAGLQLETMRARLAVDTDAERAAIFAAHQELLEDPEVLDPAAAGIRRGESAAWAWRASYRAQAARLVALRSPLLAGRAADLRDVGRRVLHLLVGAEPVARALPVDAIIVAEDLSPSDAASLDRSRVRGFCTTMGSATSHAAIVARGLGIPAVCGIDPRVLDLAEGTRVVLDGDDGRLTDNPTAAAEAEVRLRQAVRRQARETSRASATEPARTIDGHRLEVAANVGDVEAAGTVSRMGGEGIGLLRTEFLFMDRREEPDEDEQVAMYESILRAVGRDCLVVIRTLDVGGDKPLAFLPAVAEANPFLGERGVRFTLAQPALFRRQLRAILRAAPAGRTAIMFPMIATLAEWRAARLLVDEERAALGQRAGVVQVGVMVETASAALLAGHIAREADFLSVGTNDLSQYTLAMDRTNPRLAPQIDALHPAVLQLIRHAVAGAHAHARWVGVCGALAGDPDGVPILVGLGVDELSVDIPLLPDIKARIRSLSRGECEATARAALEATDAAAVRALVRERHP